MDKIKEKDLFTSFAAEYIIRTNKFNGFCYLQFRIDNFSTIFSYTNTFKSSHKNWLKNPFKLTLIYSFINQYLIFLLDWKYF